MKAARTIFELADVNKDGFITYDEVIDISLNRGG